ncbi:rhamnan synthesis F family protein [Propionimicrobium sp. PCR01-08-3]|uniref:rhamnan synthesis F family protein n=1 Tax=Propionimicrobium sp. PCR01-08-3 TaxID=3052086 RepID=UPI00255CB807|nr:rhamnan synthesis F family protein [Propionimicrobium sp. PCR01-08-3]WIY82640.1 rhamnan synthesis F family protein [Propionimicrobium sp. PCR01-08-3]
MEVDALPDRVVLVAQYSPTSVQSQSLSAYLHALAANAYLPMVISVCSDRRPLEFPYGIPDEVVVVRRPNIGYDFGSWADLMNQYPQIRACDTVLLTNDSLLGPFAPIDHLLEWAASPGPSIRALTQSFQFTQHMQSYFLAFRGGILADEPWVEFFNSVKVEPDKEAIVQQYEIGASRLAFSEAYSSQSWVTGPELGVPNGNPTVDGWRNLIETDVPFLKRTIMTHPSTMSEAVEAQRYIKRRFDADVNEW